MTQETKILYGLIGNKIAVCDADISEKAKKQCFKEKCTSVIVANKTPKLMDAFINGSDVTIDMFEGVML